MHAKTLYKLRNFLTHGGKQYRFRAQRKRKYPIQTNWVNRDNKPKLQYLQGLKLPSLFRRGGNNDIMNDLPGHDYQLRLSLYRGVNNDVMNDRRRYVRNLSNWEIEGL